MAVNRERAYSYGGSGLVDVLDRILDKGLVIDIWARVSLVGIELLTIEARIVVASVDVYLRYAHAMGLTPLAARPPEAAIGQARQPQRLGEALQDISGGLGLQGALGSGQSQGGNGQGSGQQQALQSAQQPALAEQLRTLLEQLQSQQGGQAAQGVPAAQGAQAGQGGQAAQAAPAAAQGGRR